MPRPVRAAIRQAPAARRWVTLLVLVAFFLQSLAVQTHIHPQSDTPAVARVAHVPGPSPLKSQLPLEQSGCRLCQELVHSGAVVTPAASSLLISLSFIATSLSGPPLSGALLKPAFAWKSRAPPRR